MTARILIVDDVPANTRLLEAKLSAEYYQVMSARNGLDAIQAAREWQPDLILLDVMMPGMDGFECCKKLKTDPLTLHIPVVMVTALGDSVERVRGLEASADDFLTKPVEYTTLMARTRGLVRLKRLLDEWRSRSDAARIFGLTAEDDDVALSIRGARVLVIDDCNLCATTVQSTLTSEDITTGWARDADEAVRLTCSVTFDLIVLSLSLAGDAALKLLSRLRANDATHETPLLLIAEPVKREKILIGFRLGADDCLAAPIDQNELRARSRNQIRRKFYRDRLRTAVGSVVEIALTDPLTGLYNRRHLCRHLISLVENGNGTQLSVLMVDVDHFKGINDRFGHSEGDRALKLIARALRNNVRVFDSLARYGGEEFAVIMPTTGPDEARIAAERLRTTIAALPFTTASGHDARLTISVGVACGEAKIEMPDLLLQLADRALYDAKNQGRNRVKLALLK